MQSATGAEPVSLRLRHFEAAISQLSRQTNGYVVISYSHSSPSVDILCSHFKAVGTVQLEHADEITRKPLKNYFRGTATPSRYKSFDIFRVGYVAER